MSNSNLPVKTGDDFVGEFEVMNLDALRDKTFIVAVSTGDRNKVKQLASTMHGPYDFYEMCEEVGVMYKELQHHSKVTILNKDRTVLPQILDENTVDYIEAHYLDIITEGLLDGAFEEKQEYTCQAGIVEADASEDPRKALEAPTGDVSAAEQNPLP